jgi:hypothetical protein
MPSRAPQHEPSRDEVAGRDQGPDPSTLSDLEGARDSALWGRRAALTLVALLVVAALVGVLGVHTSTAVAERGGWAMSVDYPKVARSGLDIRWRVQVQHPGGFGKTLTLAVSSNWWEIFETQGFFPEPDGVQRDGDTTYLDFDDPPGDTFVLDYDAYVQPSAQVGRTAHAAVIINDSEVVGVTWKTRLVP